MDVSQKKLSKSPSYAKCFVLLETVGNHWETRFAGVQKFVDKVSLPTVVFFCLQEVKKLTGRAKAPPVFVGFAVPALPAAPFL